MSRISSTLRRSRGCPSRRTECPTTGAWGRGGDSGMLKRLAKSMYSATRRQLPFSRRDPGEAGQEKERGQSVPESCAVKSGSNLGLCLWLLYACERFHLSTTCSTVAVCGEHCSAVHVYQVPTASIFSNLAIFTSLAMHQSIRIQPSRLCLQTIKKQIYLSPQSRMV